TTAWRAVRHWPTCSTPCRVCPRLRTRPTPERSRRNRDDPLVGSLRRTRSLTSSELEVVPSGDIAVRGGSMRNMSMMGGGPGRLRRRDPALAEGATVNRTLLRRAWGFAGPYRRSLVGFLAVIIAG